MIIDSQTHQQMIKGVGILIVSSQDFDGGGEDP